MVHDHPQTLAAFGRRVRATRESTGLSQEQLADKSGLHRTYVGSVERGERNIALLNIIRLARALEVDPGDLLSGLTT
ncbi:MAG: helix-turn-helix domain-containing protein [Gammaproteobacteria bacterium]